MPNGVKTISLLLVNVFRKLLGGKDPATSVALLVPHQLRNCAEVYVLILILIQVTADAVAMW